MTDDDQKHAVRPPGYRLGPVEDDAPDVRGPAQFGIRSLLIVQAAFAVFLALLMATGLFAVWLAFILTIVLQWGHFRIRNVALRHLVFDLMAGVALPVLCIWYDPIVFVGRGTELLAPVRTPFYLLIVLEIVALLGWLAYDTLTNRPSGFFAGILIVGCVAATIVGLVMLPLTLIGLLVLIGILGLTPFLTAYVCGRNVRRAWRLTAEDSRRMHRLLFVVGVVLAIGVPMGLDMVFGDVVSAWIEHIPFPGVSRY